MGFSFYYLLLHTNLLLLLFPWPTTSSEESSFSFGSSNQSIWKRTWSRNLKIVDENQNLNQTDSFPRGIIYNVALTAEKDVQNTMRGRLEKVNLMEGLLVTVRTGKRPLAKAKSLGKEVKVALFADPLFAEALWRCAAQDLAAASTVDKAEGTTTSATQDSKATEGYQEGKKEQIRCSPKAVEWAREVVAGVDRIIPYDEAAVPSQLPARRRSFKRFTPALWWKRIWALRHSPWGRTLALDLDARLCDPFFKVFEMLGRNPARPVHVVDSFAPIPFGGSCDRKTEQVQIPPNRMSSFTIFPERNLGALAIDNSNADVQKLLNLYEQIYIREMTSADNKCFLGDQTAWREALFLMTIVKKEIREQTVKREYFCRGAGSCDTGCWISH